MKWKSYVKKSRDFIIVLTGHAGSHLGPPLLPGGVSQGGRDLPHLALPLQAAPQPRHAQDPLGQGGDVGGIFWLLFSCEMSCRSLTHSILTAKQIIFHFYQFLCLLFNF